jgi:hypothetical protein
MFISLTLLTAVIISNHLCKNMDAQYATEDREGSEKETAFGRAETLTGCFFADQI